jgi:hypothetical protein
MILVIGAALYFAYVVRIDGFEWPYLAAIVALVKS